MMKAFLWSLQASARAGCPAPDVATSGAQDGATACAVARPQVSSDKLVGNVTNLSLLLHSGSFLQANEIAQDVISNRLFRAAFTT